MRLLFSSIIGLAFLSGCVVINDEPPFPETPAIRLVEISQDTILQFEETLILTLAYEDGDGDLGTSDPDVNTIYVQDSRLNVPDEYYLGPLAPEESTIPIQGQLNVQLSPTFLLGNGQQETTILSIYMIDRAGNRSNTVETDPILILRN
jgi:hypothetical protein